MTGNVMGLETRTPLQVLAHLRDEVKKGPKLRRTSRKRLGRIVRNLESMKAFRPSHVVPVVYVLADFLVSSLHFRRFVFADGNPLPKPPPQAPPMPSRRTLLREKRRAARDLVAAR